MGRDALSGILTIGVAVALIAVAIGAFAFHLSFLGGLALYSLTGTAATLFVAWRRYRCVERQEMRS